MSTVQPLNASVLRELPLPDSEEDADKDSRGRVLLVGGSALSPGAVLLSGLAALRGGAGKIVVATAQPIAVQLGLIAPEFGIASMRPTSQGEPDAGDAALDRCLRNCDAILLGPGLLDDNNARALALRIFPILKVPMVLDAAAITCFAGRFGALRAGGVPRIITPHAGEMASLMGMSKNSVQNSSAEIAKNAARELDCLVVLKGATTYIATPGGLMWRHDGGHCGLATAGSGDTLAGLLAALLARGASPEAASVWSVVVHAKAGTLLSTSVGPLGFLARELPPLFPQLLHDLAQPSLQ